MLEVKRTMNDSYDNTITICNTFGLEIDCIESCTSIVRNKQVGTMSRKRTPKIDKF